MLLLLMMGKQKNDREKDVGDLYHCQLVYSETNDAIWRLKLLPGIAAVVGTYCSAAKRWWRGHSVSLNGQGGWQAGG